MASHSRILNISHGTTLKRNQALRAINEGALVWDIINVSVRDATRQETMTLRAKQAAERELLDASELPGITFKPPIGAQAAYAIERRTAFEADKFYTEAIQ